MVATNSNNNGSNSNSNTADNSDTIRTAAELRRLHKAQQLQIQKALAMAAGDSPSTTATSSTGHTQTDAGPSTTAADETNYFLQSEIEKPDSQTNIVADNVANAGESVNLGENANVDAAAAAAAAQQLHMQSLHTLQNIHTIQSLHNIHTLQNIDSTKQQSLPPPPPQSPTSKLYACTHPSCNKTFSRKLNYASHYQSAHEHKKPFKCTHCDLNFARHSDRRRHEKSQHMNDQSTVYVCIGTSDEGLNWGCGKKFKRKDGLIAHWKAQKAKKKCFVGTSIDPVNRVDLNSTQNNNHIIQQSIPDQIPSLPDVDPLIKNQ